MAAVKRKTQKPRTAKGGIIWRPEDIALVPIESLQPYADNPNVSDEAELAESLWENGQFKPVVVSRGTNEIIAGNRTWRAMKHNKETQIGVLYVDVTEEEAAAITLADNRYGENRSYNMDLLAKVVARAKGRAGTGYDPARIAELTAMAHLAADRARQAAVDASYGLSDDVRSAAEEASFHSLAFGDDIDVTRIREAADGDDDEEIEGFDFRKAEEELSGAFTLKDEIKFPGVTKWGIPALLPEMLITELPSPLEAWAGSATRDHPDPEVWWLYNFGVDSTSGMKDPSRMLLAFYTWDDYFENWWFYTARHMSKAMNTGIKMAITPNFSQGDMPLAMSLWNLYRSRYLGRYFQEIGIKVMPDLECRDDDAEFIDVFRKSLPKDIPWAAVQIQNFTSRTKTKSTNKDEMEAIARWKRSFRVLFDKVDPDNLLVYANDRGREIIGDLKLACPMRHVETRITKLADKARQREKKVTL